MQFLVIYSEECEQWGQWHPRYVQSVVVSRPGESSADHSSRAQAECDRLQKESPGEYFQYDSAEGIE